VGLLHKEGPKGDRQTCLRFATGFEVGVEERQLGVLTSAVYEDDLRRWVVPQVLVHLPQGEVAAAKQHREAVLLGPAIDSLGTGPDHPLRISEDDELLALEGVQLVDDPLL